MVEAARRAGGREWAGLGLLALPLFVLAIDASVLFLAAPHIADDLGLTATQWLWVLDVYGFMIAGCLVTMGWLGDRIGRRRLLLIGAGAFAAASLCAALATGPVMLIAARAALGVAGATLMPSTLALIRSMFHHDGQRATAIAVWMTTFSAGIALGPLIGGALLEVFWWGSVFVIAIPIMSLVVLLGPRLLPESRGEEEAPVDPLSVALSIAAMLALVYGLKELAGSGPQAHAVVVPVAGVLLAVVFLRRQRRLANPLVDLTLFRARAFRTALALLTVGIFAVTGVSFLTPQFLQFVAGLSPLRAGLLTVPVALLAIAGSLTAPMLAARWGVRTVIVAGAAVSIAGFLTLSQVSADGPVWMLISGAALAALGLSPTTVLTTDLVVGSAPPARTGSAAALSETSGELGVALGIAGTGSVVTVVYRLTVGDLLPDALPAGSAAAARESITAAQDAARHLPPDLAVAVTEAARSAFASAFGATGHLAVALTVALVVIAWTGLRLSRENVSAG